MTTDELDRLEALAAEATPGPWTVLTDSEWGYDRTRRVASFITACDPDTIRRLVAAVREPLDVERLRAAIVALPEPTLGLKGGVNRQAVLDLLRDRP